MAHELPALPYAFNALEPHIDAKTMEIHHDKHHNAYVTKLNDALEGASDKSIEDVLRNINDVPEGKRQAAAGMIGNACTWLNPKTSPLRKP